MKIIVNASQTVLRILKQFYRTGDSYRMMHYCVEETVDNGVLLFNLLTREMLFLTNDEYDRLFDLDYLKSNWFIVPESFNEKECTDLVKLFVNTRSSNSDGITSYTIFPTTDCNARCFYCFELGRTRIPMSITTAKKVSRFMIDHCNGKCINIRWFGGEPLMNHIVIDTISEELRNAGIEYKSSMVSNGFLFDDSIIKKAISHWNLNKVQITLDGTESSYNKIKAFIYKDCNPYQTVLNNIKKLLDASISVIIRLNMDLHNADDLLLLSNELASRFKGYIGLYVYAHHLFKDGVPMAQMHTEEEWIKRDKAMLKIEQTIAQAGLASKQGISKKFKSHHCMADSSSAVTILPDGSIGVCEHYSESEFIGHIDSDLFDQKMIDSWKEKMEEVPECSECFYFPECIKLKKCTNASVCYEQYRTNMRRKVQSKMRNEYNKWVVGDKSENNDVFEHE